LATPRGTSIERWCAEAALGRSRLARHDEVGATLNRPLLVAVKKE